MNPQGVCLQPECKSHKKRAVAKEKTQKMNIIPYTSVGKLSFGDSSEKAISHFGIPLSVDKNRDGQKQLHYKQYILRFDAESGNFVEFTALPRCALTLNGVHIPWNKEIFKTLADYDDNLLDLYGYIVSYNLGVAVTGIHDDDESQKAIHVFMRGDWDCFNDENAKAFEMNN